MHLHPICLLLECLEILREDTFLLLVRVLNVLRRIVLVLLFNTRLYLFFSSLLVPLPTLLFLDLYIQPPTPEPSATARRHRCSTLS